jgi:hypothetical protein
MFPPNHRRHELRLLAIADCGPAMYPRCLSHEYAEVASDISVAWHPPDRPHPPSVFTAK